MNKRGKRSLFPLFCHPVKCPGPLTVSAMVVGCVGQHLPIFERNFLEGLLYSLRSCCLSLTEEGRMKAKNELNNVLAMIAKDRALTQRLIEKMW